MRKKYGVLHILKVMYDVGHQKKRSRYVILGSLWFCAGCLIFFAFAFLITAQDVFAWLVYTAMGMTIVVGVVGIIWLVRGALKQIKEETREEP